MAKLSATVTAQLPCIVKIDVQSRCRVLSQRSLEPAYLYGGRLIAISPLGVGMVRKTKAHVAWHTRHKNQYGGKIKKRKVEKKRKEKIERRMGEMQKP